MKTKHYTILALICLFFCTVQAFAQVDRRFTAETGWSIWKGDRNSVGAGQSVIVRSDMQMDTQWENASLDFRVDDQAGGRYMFGFVLNGKNDSTFGLIRFFTNNNVTNLQAGLWEYGYFRTSLNTPIGHVLVPGKTYQAIVEPNTNRKDWRPWSIKLIDKQDGKVLFEKTLTNAMPLLGQGIVGMYKEDAKTDFLDFAVSIISPENVSGKLRLAPLFKNGMVLQRDKRVSVWGYTDPAREVVVHISGKKYTAKADKSGKWHAVIGPLEATESTQMKVSSGSSSVTLTNVAVGEVWIASGQSNMEMRIWQSDVGREYGVKQDPGIRVYRQPGWSSEEALFDSGGTWIGTDDPSFETSSAIAYSFARELRNKLKVPVGIICSYWGGTGAESWLPREVLRRDPATLPIIEDYERARDALRDRKKPEVNPWFVPGQHKAPGALFNGMIHPHVPYGIRGAIWYQGESNANRAMQYHMLFPMLINAWRDVWKDAEMPFYFVQLPNYDEGKSGSNIINAWPAIREAQRLTLQKVPHTGMAITMELGSPNNIHPYVKKEVADRLSRLALHDVYGFKEVVRSGPLFSSVRFEKGKAIVHFAETAAGLKLRVGKQLQGFVVAGEDRNFVPAQAVIDEGGRSVSIYADGVESPVAIRYAWANNPEEANLANSAGLPASPFRTDNWDLFDK